MVSISIMILVLGVVLVQQSSFDGAVLLRSQAYEVALRIRDIQTTAVSASVDYTAGSFRVRYGIYMDTSANSNGLYRIFNDVDKDGYDTTSDTEVNAPGVLDSRFEIRAIRVTDTNGAVQNPNAISIDFERPNFDAYFYTTTGTPLANVEKVQIDIARRGITGTGNTVLRTIEITPAGQISVL